MAPMPTIRAIFLRAFIFRLLGRCCWVSECWTRQARFLAREWQEKVSAVAGGRSPCARAGRSVGLIASTTGNDVANLMDAMSSLRRAYKLTRDLLPVSVVC